MSEHNKIKAFRSHWVNGNDLLKLMDKLIFDAKKKHDDIKIVGNPEQKKLEGVIMSLRAVKDLIYQQEIFGDLIQIEGGLDHEDTETPTPKIILPGNT